MKYLFKVNTEVKRSNCWGAKSFCKEYYLGKKGQTTDTLTEDFVNNYAWDNETAVYNECLRKNATAKNSIYLFVKVDEDLNTEETYEKI